MIEIVAAAWVPAVAMWLISASPRWDDGFRRAVRRWFIPLVLVWLAPCWMTARSPAPFDDLAEEVWPWEQRGFTSGNPLLSDVPLQFVPWREAVKRSIMSGSLPLLDRGAGSGAPLWANPQSAVLSPITIAGLPFSGFGWPLFEAACKLFIALSGMYLFARRLQRSHTAAVFAAVAFAFCAMNVMFLLFPLSSVSILLPWLLAAIAGGSGAGVAAATWMMIAGGHPESVFHAAMLAVPFAFVRFDRRRLTNVMAGGVVALLCAAPLLLPFAAILHDSERYLRIGRQPGVTAAPPLTLENLVPFFFAGRTLPHALDPSAEFNFSEVATQYAGLATFALALAGACFSLRREWFWVTAGALAAVLSFATPLLRRVPMFDVSMNGRLRLIAAFCAVILASGAIDSIRAARGMLVAFSVATLALVTRGSWVSATAAIASAAFIAIALEQPKWRPAIPLAIFADLAVLLVPMHPPVARQFYYPTTPALRFLAQHRAPGQRISGVLNALRPNTASVAGLEDIGIHDPMTFDRYGQLLVSAGLNRNTYFDFFPTLPPRTTLDFLGVRFVIAPPGSPPQALPFIYRAADATIYENPTAEPRAFSITPGVTVRFDSYRPNGESLVVKAGAPSHIATSEVAMPGWRLTRDGVDWPFVRLRGVFIGFDAPPGLSRFELSYVPPYLEAGALLSAAGLVGFLILLRRERDGSAAMRSAAAPGSTAR